MSTQKTADEKPRRNWRLFGGSAEKTEETAEPERGVTAGKGRATPGRRATEEVEGNVVTRGVGGIREYFEGVNAEIRKVSWPTREETRRLSTIVLITTILASLALGLVSFGFSKLFEIGLTQPMLFLGFFILVIVVGFVLYRRSGSTPSST